MDRRDRSVYRKCQITDPLGSWYMCEILDVVSWDLEILYNPERCVCNTVEMRMLDSTACYRSCMR